MPPIASISFTVPCSVNVPEADGSRVKLNVDPGASGPRIVIMGLGPDMAPAFEVGARYSVVITRIPDEPAAETQTLEASDIGDAAEVIGS